MNIIIGDLDSIDAFNILLDTLKVELKEDVPSFKVNEFGDIVCDYDDRGELYLALYHLATKICPNTEFRNLFEDPNTIMASLYTEARAKNYEKKDINNTVVKLHTCGRCEYEKFPYSAYPCNRCIYGSDLRENMWKLKEEE